MKVGVGRTDYHTCGQYIYVGANRIIAVEPHACMTELYISVGPWCPNRHSPRPGRSALPPSKVLYLHKYISDKAVCKRERRSDHPFTEGLRFVFPMLWQRPGVSWFFPDFFLVFSLFFPPSALNGYFRLIERNFHNRIHSSITRSTW